MSKNRTRKPNLKKQLQDELYHKWQKGQNRSRHELKAEDKADRVISSNVTYKNYKANVSRFADYMRENHPKIKSMNEAKQYVGEYLQSLQEANKSAMTVKNYACALGKVYDCSINSFNVNFEPCRRADVVNNRGVKDSHKHIQEANYKEATDLIDRCGARHSELCKVTRNDGDKRHGIFAIRTNKETGRYYLGIRGKGGKERWAEWTGTTEEIQAFAKHVQTVKDGEQIYRAPKALPTHRHRQVYARAIYERYSRPLNELTEKEIYRCRNELKGLNFDRNALYKVQQNLGHNDLHCVTRYVF